MKRLGVYSRIPWILVVMLLVSAPNVQSQDLSQEMDKVKSELSEVKSELKEIMDLVHELRTAILESVIAQGLQTQGKMVPKEEKAVIQAPLLTDEQLTRIICPAVGTFFSEAEAALARSDTRSAESGMEKALRKLTSTLHGYTGTHRVSKLLNIYEGLAWDTYMAVRMRRAIAGNEDFLKVLRKHKQKYIETCPRL